MNRLSGFGHDPGFAALCICDDRLYAGLRREEILALQWDSVYLDAEAPVLNGTAGMAHRT